MSKKTDTPEGEVGKEQKERTERAKAAIRAGQFQITRVGPQQWSVQNGEKLPYSVSLEGETWVCTCMDYQQRGPDILCKHIEGVRLSEAAQSSIESSKENLMEHPESKTEETIKERFDRILWELRQPLDMSRVKRRQAPGLGSVPYLEGFDVIDRANAIFGFAWSFDLISEPLIARWHKKILVWNQQERRKVPVTDANGNFQTEEVGPGVHHRQGHRGTERQVLHPLGPRPLHLHRRYPGGAGYGPGRLGDGLLEALLPAAR